MTLSDIRVPTRCSQRLYRYCGFDSQG